MDLQEIQYLRNNLRILEREVEKQMEKVEMIN